MSRIGNRKLTIPAGVTVEVNGNTVVVKSSKGELSTTFSKLIEVKVEDNTVTTKQIKESKTANMMQGTANSLINNMIVGVSEGFQKTLEIVGVGYRASVSGNTLVVSAGYSHDVKFEIPKGITIELPKNTQVVVKGIDRQLVGQFAANVRSVREPEPYLGKGIHYSDEHIRRKEGKTAKK